MTASSATASRAPAAGTATATRTDAILFATLPTVDGGAAAVLPLDGTTIVGRLLAQLEIIGIDRAHVVTRPEWRDAVVAAAEGAGTGVELEVRTSPGLGGDLRAAADLASEAPGSVLLLRGDAVTQHEALAGLLADPRIVTGILVSGAASRARWSFKTRSARGRIVSAASPFHRITRGGAYFLGVAKVDPRDTAALAVAARRLAVLAEDPPPRWEQELARKAIEWRQYLWTTARREEGEEPEPPDPATWPSLPLSEADEGTLARRLRAARNDAVSLLVVGLVRANIPLAPRHLRGFYYGRPESPETAEAAERELAEIDEDKVALDSAVKGSDGFFTTFMVSPYSRYIARFAARRGLNPNQVTTLSMAIGALAAAAFATGSRPGLIAGAILLQAAFTFDCVDGQLARYTRQFSKLGAWLDSVFDRGKEYLVYVGLALGATRGFDDDVWTLAAAALTLQTVRHVLDFSYAAGQREVIAQAPHMPLDHPEDVPISAPAAAARSRALPGAAPLPVDWRPPPPPPPPPEPRTPRTVLRDTGAFVIRMVGRLDRWPVTSWGKRILVLPIGERFAVISITAAIWSPRTTFTVLLIWGGVALLYAFLGRALRSVAR